jgi:hypothetical protein
MYSHPYAWAGWSAINTERRKEELGLYSILTLMRGSDGLNDKAVLAGDESATIPRIDPLALHLTFLTVIVKSPIFYCRRYFFLFFI